VNSSTLFLTQSAAASLDDSHWSVIRLRAFRKAPQPHYHL
jgi:hypothetical protein